MSSTPSAIERIPLNTSQPSPSTLWRSRTAAAISKAPVMMAHPAITYSRTTVVRPGQANVTTPAATLTTPSSSSAHHGGSPARRRRRAATMLSTPSTIA